MSPQTRSQKMAQAAFAQIASHTQSGATQPRKDLVSIAKAFPALIHTCGLAQAITFAMAKKHTEYLGYLASVLHAIGYTNIGNARALDELAHKEPLANYLRLSRDTIEAASWLKRYVEAAAGEDA